MAAKIDGTWGRLALLGLGLWVLPVATARPQSPPAQDSPSPTATTPAPPGQAIEGQPPAGKTLVPVTDPRCAPAMPIVQTYKEVSVEEAKQPPRCELPSR
jgi:hypothetical protein